MSQTSKYAIDLIIKDDESKFAINQIQRSLESISKRARDIGKGVDIADGLRQVNEEAQRVALRLNKIAMNTEDCSELFESYQKHVYKTDQALQAQVLQLKHALSEEGKLERAELQRLKQANLLATSGSEQRELLKKISALSSRVVDMSDEELKAAILKNQQARFTLKMAALSAKSNSASSKHAKAEVKQNKSRIKAGLDWIKQLTSAGTKMDALVKKQTQLLNLVSSTAKQQMAVTDAIKGSEKAQKRLIKGSKDGRTILQGAYNITGLIGGGARTVKAGMSAISGLAQDGLAAADIELQKEKEARRIRGYDGEEAIGILNELYFNTGADYSVIVDAINRVQSTLKPSSKEQLLIGAGIELRNPGLSLALASTQTAPSLQIFAAYERRMEGLQRATGASAEQIEASVQKMANYSSDKLGSASITEVQGLYLALQNSGAFTSQEDLDEAFERFIQRRKDSSRNIFEDAQDYRWSDHERNKRLQLRMENTLQSLDWKGLRAQTSYVDTLPKPTSVQESVSEQMRRIEFQKNQLMLKLLPAVTPLLDGLAKLLNSEAGEKIIKGFLKFMEVVVPKLADIFIGIAKGVGVIVEKVTDIAVEGTTEMSNRRMEMHGAPAWMANGGIALGTTIAGERGPEAIIPLDYSRAQRAENIAFSIQNNFSMAGNQTTALALAEAVSSRDFSRAMSHAAFRNSRLGVF